MANDRPPVSREQLEEAASRLQPLEREVLALSAGDGLRNDEIADRLGIAASAAEQLLSRAIVELDRALERRERPWWRFW